MYSATWNVDVNGAAHEVRLDWTYWGGQRKVYVDDELVDENKMLMRWNSAQRIDVAGQPATVITKPHSFAHLTRFVVLLEVDGRELEPASTSSDIGVR